MADSGTFSAKQTRAIDALLTSPTVRAAAESAGVPERTLFRWLGEEPFSNELASRRREIQKQVLSSIAEYAEKAVRELGAIATGSERDSVRRAACKDVLEITLKVAAALDVDDRISKLERMLADDNDKDA